MYMYIRVAHCKLTGRIRLHWVYIYIYKCTCIYNISGLYIDIFINLSLWTMQLTKKSTCPTKFFSCPKKINKNDKNQRIIISNLCKMFWLLSHKHHLVLSLLILRDIMIMTTLIDKLAYTKSLVSLSNDVIMTWVSNHQFLSLVLE
jgi:hypothetical protein